MLETEISAHSQVQGHFSQRAKTLRRLLNLDVFGGFVVGELRFPRSSFFKTFGRLQKESTEEVACTGEGVFALVAVPEDILLQLAEELRVLLSVAEKLQVLRRRGIENQHALLPPGTRFHHLAHRREALPVLPPLNQTLGRSACLQVKQRPNFVGRAGFGSLAAPRRVCR